MIAMKRIFLQKGKDKSVRRYHPWVFSGAIGKTDRGIANGDIVDDFIFDPLVMSTCRAVSCVVGRGCLLSPVSSLGKTLLAFALLHFVLQDQICLSLQVSLDFLLLHSSPL